MGAGGGSRKTWPLSAASAAGPPARGWRVALAGPPRRLPLPGQSPPHPWPPSRARPPPSALPLGCGRGRRESWGGGGGSRGDPGRGWEPRIRFRGSITSSRQQAPGPPLGTGSWPAPLPRGRGRWGRKLQPPAARVPARWARGGRVGRVQGDRSASGRFWVRLLQREALFTCQRGRFLFLSASLRPLLHARRRRLPRLTGRPGRFPRPPARAGRPPAARVPAAPRAPRPAPGFPIPPGVGACSGEEPLLQRELVKPSPLPSPLPSPTPCAWVRLQSAARREG